MWVRVTGLQSEDLGNIHMLGVPLYTITTSVHSKNNVAIMLKQWRS